MDTIAKAIGTIFLILLFMVGVSFLFAFPTMWLWNWLMPSIFGLKVVTFWQALGINIFTGLLFRSPTTIKKN